MKSIHAMAVAENARTALAVANIRQSCSGGSCNKPSGALSCDTIPAPCNYMNELISKKDIQALFGISKSSAQRWIQTPDFPRALALNSRVLRWERLDVEAWALSKKSSPRVVRSTRVKGNGFIVIDGVVIRGVN
jgi:predicted DNA-binding transcriptional regulator AlpA